MSTSRDYHHGDLRSALLETTRALLAEVGIEGLSLREVSRQAGVSHAAAYNHFRDKGDLVRAVVEGAFARLAAEMRRARSGASEPLEALRRLGIGYVRFAYRNPAEFRIMFRPELCAAPEAGATPLGEDAYALLVDAVAACEAAGALAPGKSEPLVLAAWSMVHGLASLIVDGPNPGLAPSIAAAETLARQCVDTLADGVRSRVRRRATAKTAGRST